MTRFQQWIPVAYMNSIAHLRRATELRSAGNPWKLTALASLALAVILLGKILTSNAVEVPLATSNESIQNTATQKETQAQLATRIDRLAETVERLSARLDENSHESDNIDALHREFAALSKTTKNLRHEMDVTSKHAMQVESSISNLDVSVSTPEVLANKLEREKNGLNKP